MNRAILTIFAATILSGCAKSPENIAPSYVSSRAYDSYSCAELMTENQTVSDKLASASARQSQARQGDTIGVLLLGIPTASLSGDDVEAEVANLKGNQNAIRDTMAARNCSAG